MIEMFALIAGGGIGAFMSGYVAGAIIKAGYKIISAITQVGD
jgi:hypothetical protein